MTPEERASICSHCLTDTARSCHNNCTYYERYKAFLEQKAIDDKECESLINKACEWLVNNLGYYDYNAVCIGESLWERIAKDFRKAMTYKTNPLFEKCLANVNPETREEVRRNMDYANWTEKACEFLGTRLFPTVKVQNEDLIDVIDRWELIDEFRKAMGEKAGKPTSLTWEDMATIIRIYEHTQQLDDSGKLRNQEDFFIEVLNEFNEQRNGKTQ